MAPASSQLASDHTVANGTPLIDRPSETSETARRIERLPTEVGVLLLTAGIIIGHAPAAPRSFRPDNHRFRRCGPLAAGLPSDRWLGSQTLPESTPGRYAVSRSLPGRSGASLSRFHRVSIVVGENTSSGWLRGNTENAGLLSELLERDQSRRRQLSPLLLLDARLR